MEKWISLNDEKILNSQFVKVITEKLWKEA